ncbi:ElaB/YqjD/DUF883 family membrane-anchored ribosome-binding protein [Erythromicrobium ramosum]|uniref:ElaB/YqjD/DUF883 family membrane-anchored ribosome-binding protein n=1 Tax=Erythrobacter ramosus TaxID=35811 RepID=A0A6I4ULU9_9SPHN|nr:hypothetical protein [Erythrobacter ramosus]MBB3777176.1 ElaB/YqjD/DUF883 family membrane-anchored ribosome-binding protein [Erythrobacter ramosus]MXP39930.1 hypothetical protein [Erythrobacter ramosus]
MSNTLTDTMTGHFQDSVDTAADALKAAASGTHEFTEEASAVLATASTEITKLAESLRAHAVDAAKDAAHYAKHEVEAHPLASLAAALTAVVAVMGMMAVSRKSKHAAQ